jgi:hypothetical protein
MTFKSVIAVGMVMIGMDIPVNITIMMTPLAGMGRMLIMVDYANVIKHMARWTPTHYGPVRPRGVECGKLPRYTTALPAV